MPSRRTTHKAIIVGAGPVGCLAAKAVAAQGWAVDVYDGRSDLSLPPARAAAQQHSMSVTISSRGIAAVQALVPTPASEGFWDFLKTAISMRGRMCHDAQGHENSQLYDRHGQCIYSTNVGLLNASLLEEARITPNVQFFFRHQVQAIDFASHSIRIFDVKGDKKIHETFDLCIGADGSDSIVRKHLEEDVHMDFAKQYIPHEYIEFKIRPGLDVQGNAAFRLKNDHLHIWPRQSFMLIAIPRQDKSFACTVFAPTSVFDKLSDADAIIPWFKQYFPDALELIGEDSVLKTFERYRRSSLFTIEAHSYHYRDRSVLLGDAAHAMVPFYGQGLNCGLEDVRVLDHYLRQAGVDPSSSDDEFHPRLEEALSRYSETRREDIVAIQKLSIDNYVEMRHDVTTTSYLLRRAMDGLLHKLSSTNPVALDSLIPSLSRTPFSTTEPEGWLPSYTMVAFRPDISYATVAKKIQQQSQVVSTLKRFAAGMLGVAGAALAWLAYVRRVHRHTLR